MKKSIILLALLGGFISTAQEVQVTNYELKEHNDSYKVATGEFTNAAGETNEIKILVENGANLDDKALSWIVVNVVYNHKHSLRSRRSFELEKIIIRPRGKSGKKWWVASYGYASNAYGAEVDSSFSLNIAIKKGRLTSTLTSW